MPSQGVNSPTMREQRARHLRTEATGGTHDQGTGAAWDGRC